MTTTLERGHRSDHVFFPALATLISAIGLSGFWFTYFGPILGKTYPPAGIPLHLHGWSFFLWYLLFPLQAFLIARRRRPIHELLGRISVALATMMTLTGILVLSVRVDEAVQNGEPRVWLMYGPIILSSLVFFVGFYAAGIRAAIRGSFQAHKRLMIVASALAVGAGFFRLIFFLSGFHPLSLPAGIFACNGFILIGIVYDAVTRRSVHPVYLIGLGLSLAVQIPLLPQVSEAGVMWVNEWLAALGEILGVLYDPDPTVEF